MIDPATWHLALLSAVTASCGLPLGLMLRSAAESKSGSGEPPIFIVDGVAGFVGTLVTKALGVTVLFWVPSLLLLHLFGHDPRNDQEMRLWLLSNLIGVGVGKWIRWLRWRRTQDFL